MGERRDDPELYWVDPRLRAASCRSTASTCRERLARTVRADRFEVTRRHRLRRRDAAPAPSRGRAIPRPGSTSRSSTLYSELFARGHAHSVECRRDGRAGRRPLRRVGRRRRSSARACSAASATPRRWRWSHLVARLDQGRLPPARHPVHDRASAQLRRDRDSARGVPHLAGRRGRPDRAAFSASWAATIPAPSCRRARARRRRRGRAPRATGSRRTSSRRTASPRAGRACGRRW